MQAEFNIDHLLTYATEPADAERLAPNPERRKLQRALEAKKAQLGRAHVEHAQLEAKGASSKQQQQAKATLERLQGECDVLNARIRAAEKRVPLKAIQDPDTIVHHETECKTLTQLIKVVAYRSESCLARMIEPFFARHDDEVRAFLKAVSGHRPAAPLRGDPVALNMARCREFCNGKALERSGLFGINSCAQGRCETVAGIDDHT